MREYCYRWVVPIYSWGLSPGEAWKAMCEDKMVHDIIGFKPPEDYEEVDEFDPEDKD